MSSNFHTYHVAILMIAPPLTSHLFLHRITIGTNNYRDIPPRFGQALTVAIAKAVTIAIGHERDCYADTSELEIDLMKSNQHWSPHPKELLPVIPHKGLTAERQWYVYDS